MKNKKKRFFSGHTFVELLAILAVLAIMLAVSLTNLNPGKNEAKLKAAQREVASAIRMAQSNALQGKTVYGSVPKFWGFKFKDNNTYAIFYIISTTDTTEYEYETHDLNNGVIVSNPASPYEANTKVTFSTPNASVALPSGAGASLELTLQIGSSANKKVTITSSGVITED